MVFMTYVLGLTFFLPFPARTYSLSLITNVKLSMGFMKTLSLKLAHADLNEMLNGNFLDVPHVLTDSNFGTNILLENAGLTSNNFLE